VRELPTVPLLLVHFFRHNLIPSNPFFSHATSSRFPGLNNPTFSCTTATCAHSFHTFFGFFFLLLLHSFHSLFLFSLHFLFWFHVGRSSHNTSCSDAIQLSREPTIMAALSHASGCCLLQFLTLFFVLFFFFHQNTSSLSVTETSRASTFQTQKGNVVLGKRKRQQSRLSSATTTGSIKQRGKKQRNKTRSKHIFMTLPSSSSTDKNKTSTKKKAQRRGAEN